MIQLLIGPYRSGKTGRMLEDLVQYKRDFPLDSCLILVPSRRYGELLHEQLVSLLRGTGGIFGVKIATVYEACEHVVRNSGVAPVILPRDLCAEVVADAVSRLAARGELQHLQPIAGMRGTCSALYGLIDEFERAALTPSDVLLAVNATSSQSSRHHELASIYKEYWARLDELKATDQKRLAFTCREILASTRIQSGWSAGSNSTRVLMVDGFDRISALQAEVIRALSQHAAVTKISFDYVLPEQRQGLHDDISEDEYAWKDSSFAELHSRFPVQPETTSRSNSSSKPANVAGFRAIERFFETQEMARRCKQVLQSEAAKPEDILVVARNIDDYSDAIRGSFADAGIPFFIDEAVQHNTLPLSRFLLSLFSLAINEFPRRQVIDCLRSPFCNLAGLGLNKTNIEALDRKSLDAGILGGRAQWQAFLDAGFNEELSIKFDTFFDLVTPRARNTTAEHCRWLEDTIDLLRKPAAARSADDLSATASGAELEALAGFRNALNNLLLKEQLFAPGETDYSEFFAHVQTILDNSTLRRQPSTPENVYICSAEHAPNKRFDHLFVLGAQEGNFPKHSGESGFLSSDERARWAGYGIKLTNPREEPGFERALFKSLIDRARHNVVISCPTVDMSGDEVFPSFFLTDGTVNLETFARVDVANAALKQPYSARESVASWLWHSPGIEVSERMEQQDRVQGLWERISRTLLGAWSRHGDTAPGVYNGFLLDLTQSGWLKIKSPSVLSASALNDYGQCPFKFWLSRLLSATPRTEPEAGLNAQFKGSLFHRALEIYYSRLVQIHPDERLTQKASVLKESLEQAAADLEKEPKFHPSPYWRNEQKELLFRLNRFIEFDETRLARDRDNPQAALFEARFGMHGQSYPPVSIQTANGTINVRGIIDRIDISESAGDGAGSGNLAVTVIDYKSGSTPITGDDIGAFAQIQLPLYAMAVQQSILPGAKVTAGQYLSVNAAKSIGSVNFQNEKWSDLIANARQQIKKSLEAMTNGDFSVRPYAAKACNNCDHASVCRIADMKQFQPVTD